MNTIQPGGIDGLTGQYLFPELTPEDFVRSITGETTDARHLAELRERARPEEAHLGLARNIDPKRLDRTGWGILFPQKETLPTEALLEALRPLLDWRRSQAGGLYRQFDGPHGYRQGEHKASFLLRHGAGPGSVEPRKMPYYLLLVGSPEAIPFTFQYQLDVQFAVGRIHFDTLEDYENYARSVVAAEKGQIIREKKASFFSTCHPGDRATRRALDQLATPLADYIETDHPTWTVDRHFKDRASKSQLRQIFRKGGNPALFFGTSHGLGFPVGDPLQQEQQGALVCQEWPGPDDGIHRDHYFTAEDVPADAHLSGLLSVFFACYSLGTPQRADFGERLPSAPRAFLSQLPQSLLAHKRGGALAVVGHVDRVWSCSFSWGDAIPQTTGFETMIHSLFEGQPIGSAMESLDQRYAELSEEVLQLLNERKYGLPVDSKMLSRAWVARNDARNYAILGDPAVRLAV